MNLRRIVTCVFLLIVMLVDRFTYYGLRTFLMIFLMRDLGMTTSDAGQTMAAIGGIGLLTPLIGGLVAMAVGPGWTLVAGAVMVAGAQTTLGSVPSALVTPVLVLLILGEGLLRPSLFAIIGRELADPREPARAGVTVGTYGAVNLGALLGPMLAGALAAAGGSKAVFTVMGWVSFGAIALTLTVALLPRLMPHDDAPVERPGAMREVLILFGLCAPVFIGMSAVGDAAFNHPELIREARWLQWLNPTVVLIACGAAGLVILVLAVTPVKWPLRLPIAIGSLVFAAGAAVMVIAPEGFLPVIAASTVVCALGEVLVVPFALARAMGGLPPRQSTLIIAGWLAASNALSFVVSTVAVPLGTLPILILAVAGCATAGVLLLVKRDLI